MTPPYNYVAFVPYGGDVAPYYDMTKWCAENFGKDGGVEWCWIPSPTKHNARLMFFRDHTSLVAFKLRFGESISHTTDAIPEIEDGWDL